MVTVVVVVVFVLDVYGIVTVFDIVVSVVE